MPKVLKNSIPQNMKETALDQLYIIDQKTVFTLVQKIFLLFLNNKFGDLQKT